MSGRILLAITASVTLLTACGGGGGSSTPPVPGGGGPTPSASGTPRPSNAPSSSPGPGFTPTPLPTASPTPVPPGQTILPDTTGRFSLMQVLDRRMTTQQIASEAPYEDAVWGTFNPSAWNGAHPGMIVSRYLMPFDDDSAISGHDLAWWQANHPDWILYACDQNGNPTHYVARADGFPNVPLDIHNPQVIQYQIHDVEAPYLTANGYNSLAADNITFRNYTGGPNALLGQSVPGENFGQDGWYGCGIWEGNTFVKRYTTGYLNADPNFTADLVNWVQTVHSMFATDPTLTPYHFKLLINHPINSLSDPNEQAVILNSDAMMTESSFSNWARYGANFPQIIQYMQYAQSHHVAWISVNYYCANGGVPCETSVTPSQLEFAMASYQLGNEGGATLYVSPSTGDIYSYHPEFATRLGKPCAEYGSSGTMYYRQFSGGLVVANNSFSPAAFSLPSNHAYADIEGRAVTNPLQLNANDGYVLTTTNGC